MRLYTVCIDARPVVVMNTDTDLPLRDAVATNAEMMKAVRERKIDEALDTWLGADLRVLQHDGRALWDGDRGRLRVRDATSDEAERWHTSRLAAIDAGDQEEGDEDWLIFLVPVAEGSPQRRSRSGGSTESSLPS